MRSVFLERVFSKNPYPARDPEFSLCGRLAKIQEELFIRNQKVPGDLQLELDFSVRNCLHEGDLVEAKTNSKGEIVAIRLLAPSLISNPFDDHRISKQRAQDWQQFIGILRDFFLSRDFVEIRTPTLVPSPGLEPFLDPFKTELILGKKKETLYLPTSPEFHLKKALALGFDRCFEFKECFRNGEEGSHHQPEFLMLEWYRGFENMEAMIRDVGDLVEALAQRRPKICLMEDLWREFLDFDLKPTTTLTDLRGLARGVNLSEKGFDFDDLFHLIFLEKIEKEISKSEDPIIVYHYPPSQAALARLTKEGWADRFELYWKGIELANAFHELNDPAEQISRFSRDQEKKESLGKDVVPVDGEFIKALEYGMPPSCGIALGVERLFMALFGIGDIRECRLFPRGPY